MPFSGSNLTRVFYFLYAVAFVFLFVENFYFSRDWALLSIREIDDYALQWALREIHQKISQGDLTYLFANFSYAYGTLFWFTHAVLLYPFYLMGSTQGLIVGGREISLFFCAGGIAFLVGIAKRYTKHAHLPYAVGLLALLCAAIPYAATRFHVNSQVFFYGMGSLYFLLRKAKPQLIDFLLSALWIGLAIGSKLVAVFLLPLLFLIAVERVYKNKLPFWILLVTGLTVVLVSLLALYPPMLFSPFVKTQTNDLIGSLRFYIAYSKVNDLGPLEFENPFFLLKNGFFYFYVASAVFVWLGYFWVQRIRKDLEKKNYDTAIFFGVYLFLLIYVLFNLKKGPSYFGQYFLAVGPLYCLGLVGLERWKGAILNSAFLICVAQVAFNFDSLKSAYAYSTQLYHSDYGQGQLEAYEDIKKIVGIPKPEKVFFARTYEALIPYTSFDGGVHDQVSGTPTFLLEECKAGNLHTPDFIAFHEKNLYTDEKVKSYATGNERHAQAKARMEKFIADRRCAGDRYDLVYQKHSIFYYKKVSKAGVRNHGEGS